ncbi:hypothetical protein DFH94DRAFT_775511 [Russula ochroleuca]|uniref:Uncharacterized protein n=1 Tax=Russula ochroleuca TaxID=152965 RepID=A0A9P5MLT7_9AGAM|nr:hypothetical protein DFH94DRAFT_775511 [Russula ochroleuca]
MASFSKRSQTLSKRPVLTTFFHFVLIFVRSQYILHTSRPLSKVSSTSCSVCPGCGDYSNGQHALLPFVVLLYDCLYVCLNSFR